MSGTLISDLDSSPQLDGDGDLISKIMADMNGSEPPVQQQQQMQMQMQMQQQQQPKYSSGGVISSPNPNSTMQHTMDSAPATAHIIGHEHPTNADFQAAVQPRGLMGASASASWEPAPRAPVRKVAKKSWWNKVFEEMRVPILVAFMVFLFSLPIVNLVIGTYIPSFVKSTGELTVTGLLLKSLTAGATFWILQRVIVPLLAL